MSPTFLAAIYDWWSQEKCTLKLQNMTLKNVNIHPSLIKVYPDFFFVQIFIYKTYFCWFE